MVLQSNPVTIVIPTRNRVELLAPCVASIERTVDPRHVKLLIIDDQTSDPDTLRYLESLPQTCSIATRVIRPARTDGAFNYARLMNEAATHVDTPSMLLLNNDTLALAPGWLEDMAGWLSVPGVGAVGARLLFPNGRGQHAGIVIGPHHGLADHCFRGCDGDDLGYLFLARAARNVSAVTGACMLVRTDSYRRLNGMNEQDFAVAYNDVDLCLRMRAGGERVVYTPQAQLVHAQGASRGLDYDLDEHLAFITRYRGYRDPFVNPNLDRSSPTLGVDPFHVSHIEESRPLRVLMVSHNLNLEGAPIFLLELAKHLAAHEAFSILTLSPFDGPLRQRFEDAGLPVELVDDPLVGVDEAAKLQPQLRRIADALPGDFDLVIANTLNSHWAIELARVLGKPSVWFVHESGGLAKHFAHLPPDLRDSIAACFPKATRIVSAAKATADIYDAYNHRDNMRIAPIGLPLERIANYRSTHDKLMLRRKHDLPEHRRVVAIIGTTCERKGQHVFISAVERLLAAEDGVAEDALFIMVGGREGTYLESLRRQIDCVDRTRFRVFMETPDVYDFFALSDVFVCASLEESFPMVVQLAMAFELPIVTTDVFGIPEIVEHGKDALLIKPEDSQALAEQIRSVLEDPALATRLARHAWHSVQRKFDSAKVFARQARLCREAVICFDGNDA